MVLQWSIGTGIVNMALPCRNSVLTPFNFLANFMPEWQVHALGDSVQRRRHALLDDTEGLD